MKTKEERSVLKEDETVTSKSLELTENEAEQVTGGLAPGRRYWKSSCGRNNDNVSDDEK